MFSSNTSQVSSSANYIEDFFSAWLRTGTGSSQTVTTGIEEDTGALVISKSRSAATDWAWYDTFRGATKDLVSNSTAAQTTQSQSLTSFNSNGHTWGTLAKVNTSGATYVDFVLKPQPKFFDVVTWTGDGTARNISHNLGSVPGCVIIKRTDTTSNWMVSHRGSVDTWAILDGTNAFTSSAAAGTIGANGYCYLSGSTDTYFRVVAGATGYAAVNATGGTYVAYLFAHNAGGFGLTGTDNVISCGSYTTNSSGIATVELGYEPQFIIYKRSDGASNWEMFDNMRGWGVTQGALLQPNTSNAENAGYAGTYFYPTATGFVDNGAHSANTNHIYIAIRRGPMKTPTSGTSVLGLNARTGTGANATVTGSAGVTDLAIVKNRGSTPVWLWVPRLAGTGYMSSNQTDVEIAAGTTILQANPWDVMDGVKVGSTSNITNASGNTFINYLIDRAPGFMDVVCDTGTGSTHTIAHNLTVVPEFFIRKDRTGGGQNWICYHKDLGATNGINLNQTTAAYTLATVWNNTAPTASVFTVGTAIAVNSGVNYVTYLFASCPGVSKVGSYTGNGVNAAGGGQTIACGFTGGARFVLVKRTDSTGNWFVFDSARGIVAGADPYLLLNSTAAEVASIDVLDASSGGFIVNQEANTNLNVNGASYIFLAIS